MLGLKADQEVLGELVRARVPAVWRLMQDHGVMWSLVVSRWFICLFIDVLPVEVTERSQRGHVTQRLGNDPVCLCSHQTVLRIWDCLFYEGSKILFRVALTLIRHHQDVILQAQNMPDVCERFKRITRGAFVEDCHAFMQVKLVTARLFTARSASALHLSKCERCHPNQTSLIISQAIFLEPGSLSKATVSKLRESCRARIVAGES